MSTMTVRVIGTTGSNLFETVNIQSADLGDQVHHHHHQKCTQLTALQYAQGPTGQFKTIQTSNAIAVGGTAAIANGLRTIIITGYAGPS
jgi:hypothetical protein